MEKTYKFKTKVQRECLVIGDFNTVLSSKDRIGDPVTQQEVQGFKDLVETNLFTPLKSTGSHFTWCNKQVDTDRVYSKID